MTTHARWFGTLAVTTGLLVGGGCSKKSSSGNSPPAPAGPAPVAPAPVALAPAWPPTPTPPPTTGNPPTAGDPPRKASPGAARIEGNAIELRGKSLPVPFTIDALKGVLGEPSRVANVGDRVYTWDDVGVYAFTRGNSNQVHELNFTLSDPGTTRLQPKAAYAQEVVVGPVAVTPATTAADLKAGGFRQKVGFADEHIKVVGALWVTVRFDKPTQSRVIAVYATVPALEFGK